MRRCKFPEGKQDCQSGQGHDDAFGRVPGAFLSAVEAEAELRCHPFKAVRWQLPGPLREPVDLGALWRRQEAQQLAQLAHRRSARRS